MNGFYKLHSHRWWKHINLVDKWTSTRTHTKHKHYAATYTRICIWIFVVLLYAQTKRWLSDGNAFRTNSHFIERRRIINSFFSSTRKKKRQIRLGCETFMIDTSKWFIRVPDSKSLKRQIFAPMNRIINCFWCEHLLHTG